MLKVDASFSYEIIENCLVLIKKKKTVNKSLLHLYLIYNAMTFQHMYIIILTLMYLHKQFILTPRLSWIHSLPERNVDTRSTPAARL